MIFCETTHSVDFNILHKLASERISALLCKSIFNQSFWANGKDAALDISLVIPLQQELVRKVARDGDSGVQHSFNIKMGKYSDRCEAEGIEFIPLIVDTFGGWHKESLEVVSKLGRQVSRQTGKEEEEIVRQLRQRVAILLVRDNVNMFDSRTPSFPQAVIDADVDNNY